MMISTKTRVCALLAILAPGFSPLPAQAPSRVETVTPIRNVTLDRNGKTKQRKQGGNPRKVAGYLAFDGAMDYIMKFCG